MQLVMSCLIWIYPVWKFNMFIFNFLSLKITTTISWPVPWFRFITLHKSARRVKSVQLFAPWRFMVRFYDYNNLYETPSFDLLHIIWSLYKVKIILKNKHYRKHTYSFFKKIGQWYILVHMYLFGLLAFELFVVFQMVLFQCYKLEIFPFQKI